MKMKTNKFLTSLFAICIILCSCGRAARVMKVVNEVAPKTVYTSDIDIRTINGINYAYYRGETYSGDVYSNNERHKMVIRNGLAVVAYSNYGVHSGNMSEKEMAINEDINSLEQKVAAGFDSPGINLSNEIYVKPKIEALRSLPNCSFSR